MKQIVRIQGNVINLRLSKTRLLLSNLFIFIKKIIHYFKQLIFRSSNLLLTYSISILLLPFNLMIFIYFFLKKTFTQKKILKPVTYYDHLAKRIILFKYNSDVYIISNMYLFVETLKGKLLLVGPAISKTSEHQKRLPHLNDIKPGLFSVWSLRKASKTNYEGIFDTNLEYLYTTSPLKDIFIVIRAMFSLFYISKEETKSKDLLLFDIHIINQTMSECISSLENLIENNLKKSVFYVNPDCINKLFSDKTYFEILKKNELTYPDGIGLILAAKILKKPFIENLNGTDMLPLIMNLANTNKYSVYFLGATQTTVCELVKKMNIKYPNVKVSGYHHGFFDKSEEMTIIKEINRTQTNILFVAFGAPMQEKWIDKHLKHLNVNLAMGVGGLFNFYSERIPRAPRWMRESGLEWVHRLLMEPKRMWKRYIIGNPLFLYRVLKWKYLKH